MAMTPQEARVIALRMRAQKPELQNMPMDNLIAKIMMAEGNPDPGATAMTPGGPSRETVFDGLANIFPAKMVTPASPAPMQPGVKLEAPKPTAQMVPPAVGGPLERPQVTPDQVRQMPTRAPAPAAAPEPAMTDEPMAAPKKAFQSRFKPLLDSTMYELDQLDKLQQAAAAEQKEVPPEIAEKVSVLSDRANRLKALVAAEEGAIVDADRAALLERQTKRLGREEELIEQARKRAPGEALIKFGAALAGAQKGESFASALARGLQAGSESYSSARESREDAKRRIEERRDALTLQNIDALQKARDEAIRMNEAGYTLDKQQIEMANLTDQQIINKATRGAKIEGALAQASKLKTEAEFAPILARADEALKLAQAGYYKNRPTETDSSGIPKGLATIYGTLGQQAKSLRDAITNPYVSSDEGVKKRYQAQLAQVEAKMAQLEGAFGIGAPPPAAPAKPPKPGRILSSVPIK